MTVEVALVISFCSFIFALYSGIANLKRNQKTDDRKDAAQMTTVIVKLENISAGITEIKSEMASMKNDVKDLNTRLVVVEQSTKSAHKRLDEICATKVKDIP
jgi:chromosome segregation ATPase